MRKPTLFEEMQPKNHPNPQHVFKGFWKGKPPDFRNRSFSGHQVLVLEAI